MKCPYCIKVCTKCGKILVANNMNFHKKKRGKYGVASICKVCRNESEKEYYETNKDKIKERSKEYYETNKEYFSEKHKEYYIDNKKEILEKQKEYYENNSDKIKEYRKNYRKNSDKIKEINRRYYQNNLEKFFNNNNKRRLKSEEQGKGITKEQWLEMMNFFNFRCAYSGEQLDKDNRSIDHLIPLSLGGENEIWNCVPMLRNLNSSKNANDMLEYYKQQPFFSEERLNKIYEWQEYARNKYSEVA